MGLMKAAKLCPQAILLPVDFDEVGRVSRQFKQTILDIAPVMEDRGIDEVYIDLTDVPGSEREGGRELARRILRSILDATRLTCSIGIAPNKLLAKLANEFDKPNGISIVTQDDLSTRIWPLPCRKVNGIGPRTDEKLQAHGIRTVGDLAARERDWLIEHFGERHGAWLHDAAWGRDDRPVVTQRTGQFQSRDHLRARPARGAMQTRRSTLGTSDEGVKASGPKRANVASAQHPRAATDLTGVSAMTGDYRGLANDPHRLW